MNLNYDDDNKNIDTKTEREKVKDIINDSLLTNSDWYLVPKYVKYKAKVDWFDYNNVVEFVLKRKTDSN